MLRLRDLQKLLTPCKNFPRRFIELHLSQSVLQLTLLGAALLTTSISSAAIVENLRTYRSPDYTRIVFDLDKPLKHTIFALDNPDRVVIDLQASSLAKALDITDIKDTPIARIRSGTRNTNDVRVVFDLERKVLPRAFLLGPNEQYGDRLIIDLYDEKKPITDNRPEEFVEVLEKATSESRKIVVAISAGHGGEDPGAIGVRGLREKDVVLSIAQEIAKGVNSIPGFTALMIREDDYYVGLREQVAQAHANKADLFIAIHADAYSSSYARGATLYALSQTGATSEQARLLAEKENEADLIGGVGNMDLSGKDEFLASVLLDMSLSASIANSIEIGETIISKMQPSILMRRTNVEQAAFVVLKSANIPSLLIEAGYITNPEDARNLDSSIWQSQFANCIVEAIVDWFYERTPSNTWLAWHKSEGGLSDSYTVVRGDTLSELAERFHISMTLLKKLNNMKNNNVQVGQVLKLPIPGINLKPEFLEHTVKTGESLSLISARYNVRISTLKSVNRLYDDTIRIGQTLKIPNY